MGQDGVINQAKDAKTQTNNKIEEEQINVKLEQFAMHEDITREVMEREMGDLIDTKIIIGNGPWIVKGKSGVSYTVEPDGNVTEMTSEEVGIMETSTIADKKGKVLSDKSIVTIKDSLGNYVRVPKGFKISSESGENVGNGIVIEDTAGNQFVWVPVGEVKKKNGGSGTVTIPLGRYENFTGTPTPKQGTSTGYVYTTKGHSIKHSNSAYTYKFYEFANDTESKNVTGETYGNTKAKDIEEFVKSASTNGGYYIGRYEAGIKEDVEANTSQMKSSQNNSTMNIAPNDNWTAYQTNDNKDPTMVCKAGKQVWNYITQKKAVSLSQNMYGAGAGVTSDLMNSYAWDTAIIFIQQCSNSNYASEHKGESSVQSPGVNKDEQCKINDMAGNITEWTTECSADSKYACVNRGGSYTSDENYTSRRFCNSTSNALMSIGFRPILYL